MISWLLLLVPAPIRSLISAVPLMAVVAVGAFLAGWYIGWSGARSDEEKDTLKAEIRVLQAEAETRRVLEAKAKAQNDELEDLNKTLTAQVASIEKDNAALPTEKRLILGRDRARRLRNITVPKDWQARGSAPPLVHGPR